MLNPYPSYGRILSVDNEPRIRESIASALEDSGFTVYEANNGEEALTIFRERKPDIVLTDLQMDGMSGLDLLEILKKEDPQCPVIVVAGTEKIDKVLEALRLGAWDYVAKPLTNMAVLEHAVCRALERARLSTQLDNYRRELEKKNSQLKESLTQLKEDQEAGRSVQQLLLPKSTAKFQNYHLSHKVLPSLYLSGDFVDYFKINSDKIGFYIADVSGHGASSAFITVLLKGLVEQMLLNYQIGHSDEILQPSQVLKHINENIYYAKLGKYLTMIYCILDVKENKLTYSVGGHHPNPVIHAESKTYFLPGRGFAVGIYKEASFEDYHLDLPGQFTIGMFSDGIFEVLTGTSLEDKEQLLLNIVNSNLSIDKILKAIGVKENKRFPDDIALMLLSRK